jgi:very-short-patch-repair endonuclease
MITGWLQARPHVARFGNQLAIMPFSGRHSLNLPRRTTGVGNPALMGRAELFGLVARQDGLVTDAQALDLGMAARTLRRRVRREGWARVAPGVLLVAGHPWNDRARVRASGLWAGSRGVVSGPAAAWWHGMLPTAPAQVELTVASRCGLRAREGMRIRHRDLDQRDVVAVSGIALTAKPLTALETAVAVRDGSAFLDRALQKHVGFAPLYRSYCRNLGAYGNARIAELLVAAADRADSAAERVIVGLLRGAGVTGWELGVPFGPWTIDLAFPDAKVAVEVDGWAWHVDVDRFRSDRHKGNAPVRAGWTVLRFTWHDLVNRPAYVVAEIRAALA